ncbi:hypothetical protein D3C78_1505960 [compost metagenome]
MIHSPAFGFVVDADFMVQVQGHLGPGWDVNGRKGFTVELVDPITDVANATADDRVQRAVAAVLGQAQVAASRVDE